jgi:hypothetical protein
MLAPTTGNTRRGEQNLRRQASAAGFAREGSSPSTGLDPLRLPALILAHDDTADGGIREVLLSREHVEVRRSVGGIPMRVRLPVSDFAGIAVRVCLASGSEPQIFLALEHRDEGLRVVLHACADAADAAIAGRRWSRYFAKPVLIAGADGRLRLPGAWRERGTTSARRRKHAAVRNRHSAYRERCLRVTGKRPEQLYCGEREIVARD